MYSCTGAGQCARNVASCQYSAINGNMYNQNSKTPVNSTNTTNSTLQLECDMFGMLTNMYTVWYAMETYSGVLKFLLVAFSLR